MTRDGFDCYMLYLALQRHFSTSYDFFKYNGKVKASKESYQNRNDMFSFEKFSKIIKEEDRVDFLVAHFLEDPKCWIKNMSKPALERYNALYRTLPRKFREDLENIQMRGPANVMKTGSDIPQIHKMVLEGSIAIESVILLNKIYSFMDKHEKEIQVPFVWPDYIKKFKKYEPFVEMKTSNNYNSFVDIAKDVLLRN